MTAIHPNSGSQEFLAQETTSGHIFQRFLHSVSTPSPKIINLTRRKQSSLLSVLLMSIIGLTSGLTLLVRLIETTDQDTIGSEYVIPLILVGVLGVAYILNRNGFYRIAAWLTIGIIGLSFLALSYFDMSNILQDGRLPQAALFHQTGFLLAVLLTSVLFSWRGTLLIYIAGLAGTYILMMLLPRINPFTFQLYSVYYTAICGMLLVFMWYRNTLERERQAELRAAVQNAQQANTELKQTNVALVKAKAMTQESLRLRSEFLNTMSHELRTPLNAIMGFTGIMLSGMGGEYDDDVEHMLKRIEVNGKHLLTLINDVLDLSKIEAGRMQLAPEQVVIRDLVTRWIDANGVLASNKGLRFDTTVEPNVSAMMFVDPNRLTQIVTNLLSNAVKFTNEGQIVLSVSQHEDWLHIDVTDTGVGIPPHALNYIFEEFRQIDGTSTRVYGGSGLGLAIVRNLCHIMNGSVSVMSELGKGSKFTVKLPLVASDSQDTVFTDDVATLAAQEAS